MACIAERGEGDLDYLTLLDLAKGPNEKAFSFQQMTINGYHFRTQVGDIGKKTQNAGVATYFDMLSQSSVKDQNPQREVIRFFGKINKILELDFGSFNTILLHCDWYRSDMKGKCASSKTDKYGFQLVNMTKKMSSSSINDQPFVMPTHVHQVFFVQDPKEKNWSVVLDHVPRGGGDHNLLIDLSLSRDFSCPSLYPHDMLDAYDGPRMDEEATIEYFKENDIDDGDDFLGEE